MRTTHHTQPRVIDRDTGDHFHFLNHLATVKVAAGEDGALSVVEFVAGRGFGPPLHVHRDEDELFILLDGEIEARSGEMTRRAGEGAYVFLPRGVPHTFQVVSSEARIATITAGIDAAPRFDQMVAELGVPISGVPLPPPGPIDPARVAEVCAAHGIDILGPPPPPLD